MSKRLKLTIATGLALGLSLLPAGLAQAAWHDSNWCGRYYGYSFYGTTLGPGEYCTSWPAEINELSTGWQVTKAGKGKVVLYLAKYGSQDPVPGVPGPIPYPLDTFGGWTDNGEVGDTGWGGWWIYKYNPYARYSHRYGQARILNYSSATIRITDGGFNRLHYWTP